MMTAAVDGHILKEKTDFIRYKQDAIILYFPKVKHINQLVGFWFISRNWCYQKTFMLLLESPYEILFTSWSFSYGENF